MDTLLHLSPKLTNFFFTYPMELFNRSRWRHISAQFVSCCVYEITKQYRQCLKGNNQICLATDYFPLDVALPAYPFRQLTSGNSSLPTNLVWEIETYFFSLKTSFVRSRAGPESIRTPSWIALLFKFGQNFVAFWKFVLDDLKVISIFCSLRVHIGALFGERFVRNLI